MTLSWSIKVEYNGLPVGLTPISQGIRVRQRSIQARPMLIREVSSTGLRNLQSSALGHRLDRNTQAKDLISEAYKRKMPIRPVTFHLQLLIGLFLSP